MEFSLLDLPPILTFAGSGNGSTHPYLVSMAIDCFKSGLEMSWVIEMGNFNAGQDEPYKKLALNRELSSKKLIKVSM